MATISKKNMFNEATRVQMPAMVHLTRLGYTYFGKITEDIMICFITTERCIGNFAVVLKRFKIEFWNIVIWIYELVSTIFTKSVWQQ